MDATCTAPTPLIDPLDNSNCIAEYEGRHCPAQNMIPNPAKNGCESCSAGEVEDSTDEETCRPLAAGDCAAGEIFDGGMCRPVNAGDCGGNSDNEIPQAENGLANCTACATIDSATPLETTDGLSCRAEAAGDCAAGDVF